jgi:hypothetical protein
VHLTRRLGYVRVKRFEMSIRAAHAQGAGAGGFTPEDAGRDAALRRNLEEVFGITIRPRADDEAPGALMRGPAPRDENEARVMQEEARLERDLRAAGLL